MSYSTSTSDSSSSSSPSSPSTLLAELTDPNSSLHAYRRGYLYLYSRIYDEVVASSMFLSTLRLYCARTGKLKPHEVEELEKLKQRALQMHPPAKPLMPYEALDDAFRAVILTSCAPMRAGKYLAIVRHVCRSLYLVLRRKIVGWFQGGLQYVRPPTTNHGKARVLAKKVTFPKRIAGKK